MYFRKILSYSAIRLVELSELIGIDQPVQEEIWGLLKYIYTEKVNLCVDKHLD